MKNTIKDINKFLVCGVVKQKQISITLSLKRTLVIFILSIFVIFSSIFFIWLLFKTLHFELPKNHVQETLEKKGKYLNIFLSTVWIPITEELGHRLWLKYSKWNMTVSAIILSYYLLTIAIKFLNLHSYAFTTKLLISAFIGFAIFNILARYSNIAHQVEIWHSRHILLLCWLSILLFSSLHIFNFNIDFKVIYLIPLIIFPQVVSGITLTYTRLKYGIWYAVFLHSLINFVSFFRYL